MTAAPANSGNPDVERTNDIRWSVGNIIRPLQRCALSNTLTQSIGFLKGLPHVTQYLRTESICDLSEDNNSCNENTKTTIQRTDIAVDLTSNTVARSTSTIPHSNTNDVSNRQYCNHEMQPEFASVQDGEVVDANGDIQKQLQIENQQGADIAFTGSLANKNRHSNLSRETKYKSSNLQCNLFEKKNGTPNQHMLLDDAFYAVVDVTSVDAFMATPVMQVALSTIQACSFPLSRHKVVTFVRRSILMHAALSREARHSALWSTQFSPLCFANFIKHEAKSKQAKTVLEFREWLRTWKSVLVPSYNDGRKSGSQHTRWAESDEDDELHQDSDVEEDLLCTVYFVSGPVGCGKSTLVKAMASDEGFNVIEVTSVQQRSAANLTKILAEATQSQSVQMRSDKNNSVHNIFNDKQVRSAGQSNRQKKEARNKNKGMKQNLIFFDEVDVHSATDKGFYATIRSFAHSARCPIILVCNCIPEELRGMTDTHHLRLAPLRFEQVVAWIQTTLLTHGVILSQQKVQRLVELRGSDIRALLAQLQFWIGVAPYAEYGSECGGKQAIQRAVHEVKNTPMSVRPKENITTTIISKFDASMMKTITAYPSTFDKSCNNKNDIKKHSCMFLSSSCIAKLLEASAEKTSSTALEQRIHTASENETPRIIATQYKMDWRELLKFNSNRPDLGRLTSKSKFMDGTVIYLSQKAADEINLTESRAGTAVVRDSLPLSTQCYAALLHSDKILDFALWGWLSDFCGSLIEDKVAPKTHTNTKAKIVFPYILKQRAILHYCRPQHIACDQEKVILTICGSFPKPGLLQPHKCASESSSNDILLKAVPDNDGDANLKTSKNSHKWIIQDAWKHDVYVRIGTDLSCNNILFMTPESIRLEIIPPIQFASEQGKQRYRQLKTVAVKVVVNGVQSESCSLSFFVPKPRKCRITRMRTQNSVPLLQQLSHMQFQELRRELEKQGVELTQNENCEELRARLKVLLHKQVQTTSASLIDQEKAFLEDEIEDADNDDDDFEDSPIKKQRLVANRPRNKHRVIDDSDSDSDCTENVKKCKDDDATIAEDHLVVDKSKQNEKSTETNKLTKRRCLKKKPEETFANSDSSPIKRKRLSHTLATKVGTCAEDTESKASIPGEHQAANDLPANSAHRATFHVESKSMSAHIAKCAIKKHVQAQYKLKDQKDRIQNEGTQTNASMKRSVFNLPPAPTLLHHFEDQIPCKLTSNNLKACHNEIKSDLLMLKQVADTCSFSDCMHTLETDWIERCVDGDIVELEQTLNPQTTRFCAEIVGLQLSLAHRFASRTESHAHPVGTNTSNPLQTTASKPSSTTACLSSLSSSSIDSNEKQQKHFLSIDQSNRHLFGIDQARKLCCSHVETFKYLQSARLANRIRDQRANLFANLFCQKNPCTASWFAVGIAGMCRLQESNKIRWWSMEHEQTSVTPLHCLGTSASDSLVSETVPSGIPGISAAGLTDYLAFSATMAGDDTINPSMSTFRRRTRNSTRCIVKGRYLQHKMDVTLSQEQETFIMGRCGFEQKHAQLGHTNKGVRNK